MTSPYRSQPIDDRHIPEDTAQEIADMAVAEHADGVDYVPVGRTRTRPDRKHVGVRFDRDMIAQAIPIAEAEGVTVSTWIRNTIAAAIRVRQAAMTDEIDLPDNEIRRMWHEAVEHGESVEVVDHRPADLSDAPDEALSPEWRARRHDDDDDGFIVTGVTVDRAVWATTDDPEVATRFRSVLNGLGYTVNVTRDGEDLTDRPIYPEAQ